MAAPHYVGDDVAVSFVVLEAGQAIVPIGATVTVYNPKGKVIKEDSAKIDNNEVSYTISGDIVNMEGTYKAVFTVRLPGGVERQNPVEVDVKPLPIKGTDTTLDIADIGYWLKDKTREEKEELLERLMEAKKWRKKPQEVSSK